MEILNQIPENILSHIKEIIKDSNLPDTDESLDTLTKNWLEKEKMFAGQINALQMHEIDHFEKDDQRGALMLTYSGSIISIGTVSDNVRWMEYASIKLRNNVPDIVKSENSELESSLTVNRPAYFKNAPIQQTSSLYKIVTCSQDIDKEEQERRITEATIFLTNGFVKINQNTIIEMENVIDHYTMKSIIDYVSEKNDLPKNKTKQLIEDFIQVIENGVLSGKRVPIGKLGHIKLRLKTAQKARIIKNPITGEQITVNAKPAKMIPRVSFSSSFKEKSAQTKIEEE